MENPFEYWESLKREKGWEYAVASIGATALFTALVVGIVYNALKV